MSDAAPKMEILAYIMDGTGWDPINHMVELATSMFDARLRTFDKQYWTNPSALQKADMRLRGRRRTRDAPYALGVVNHAPTALSFLNQPDWRNGYNRVFLWIIDSFWTERIPDLPLDKVFDAIFITYAPDVEEHQTRTGIPTYHAGWGADALGLGRGNEPRDIDVLRVGRQPEVWDDNSSNAERLKQIGVRYDWPPPLPDFGRPPTGADRMAHISTSYRRAKFILAHSNLATPKPYVHPSKEYITGRWSSAIACGAVVAGVQPLTDPVFRDVLWPEAYLHTDSFEPERFASLLAKACKEWRPEVAAKNQLMSLKRLDWRWKFKDIAKVFERNFAVLNQELQKLDAEISRIERAE